MMRKDTTKRKNERDPLPPLAPFLFLFVFVFFYVKQGEKVTFCLTNELKRNRKF